MATSWAVSLVIPVREVMTAKPLYLSQMRLESFSSGQFGEVQVEMFDRLMWFPFPLPISAWLAMSVCVLLFCDFLVKVD